MATDKKPTFDELSRAAKRVRAAEKEFNEALTAAEALDMRIDFKTEVSYGTSTAGLGYTYKGDPQHKRLLVKRIVLEI